MVGKGGNQCCVTVTSRNDSKTTVTMEANCNKVNLRHLVSLLSSYTTSCLILSLVSSPSDRKLIGSGPAAQVTVSGLNIPVDSAHRPPTHTRTVHATALVVHGLYQRGNLSDLKVQPSLNPVNGKASWHSHCHVPGFTDCLFFFFHRRCVEFFYSLLNTGCGVLLRALLFLKTKYSLGGVFFLSSLDTGRFLRSSLSVLTEFMLMAPRIHS